jgi:hypothetical protein
MACKTQTKVLDGKSYEVTQIPAREALKLAAKVLKYIAPLADQDITAALATLDDSAIELVVKILSTTKQDGKLINTGEMFDECFTGDYMHLFEVLKFVVEVNNFLVPGVTSKLETVKRRRRSSMNKEESTDSTKITPTDSMKTE